MTRRKKRNVRAIAVTGALCVHVAAAVGLYFWNVNGIPAQIPATEMSVAVPQALADLPDLQTDTVTRVASDNVRPADDQQAKDPEDSASTNVVAERSPAQETALDATSVRPPVRSILFDIRWKKGSERRKLGGLAPVFPSDLAAGARVQLDVALQQDGRVKTVRVVKASDDRMKDPAVRAVRRWRFDLPKKGSARGDQSCVITFHVRMK